MRILRKWRLDSITIMEVDAQVNSFSVNIANFHDRFAIHV